MIFFHTKEIQLVGIIINHILGKLVEFDTEDC